MTSQPPAARPTLHGRRLTEPADVIRPTDRVAIFIDGENFLPACRDEGINPNWPRIIENFTTESWPEFAIYYAADFGDMDRTRSTLAEHIARSGFIVRRKLAKTMRDADTSLHVRKANLDVELTVDMLTYADRYTVAFLFSGDGDFTPLVEALRQRGKRVYVVTSRACAALELQLAADKPVFFIEDFKTTIQT